MHNAQLKAAVHYQVTKARIQELVERFVKDERGELGSWLILAAGLAIAAAAAVAALSPWFQGKVTNITSQ